ncbi:Helix-turn-helix [Hymenobacter daecheongensis DSM 21074]|uniref:Helix-turn-helix n=1 Tax=Hymenobacter daecheongensis DSM 21074 TaxID=1121955 RepID=A0A1M6IXU4_9BACT|nr:helix-turn-helix transcriptional regulator [Hymenobacter daecheongensis]SHJ39227.1 Helix-turn-helix [Hymenobacter daecheongensis DSM 21074]
MNAFSLKARKLREIHGYPQEYVAFQMGISQAAYSKKESGRTQLSVDCLTKLAALYQMSLLDLISLSAQELMLRCIRSDGSLAA